MGGLWRCFSHIISICHKPALTLKTTLAGAPGGGHLANYVQDQEVPPVIQRSTGKSHG